jgi:hypothetical protein
MLMRTLSMGAMVISLAAPAAMASGLTDQLQSERMTIVKVDQPGGRFLCAEHRHWTSAVKSDLAALRPGDIVAVERVGRGPVHLVLVRHAADELASPEQ